MKKFMLFSIVVLVTLFSVSCGGSSTKVIDNTTVSDDTAADDAVVDNQTPDTVITDEMIFDDDEAVNDTALPDEAMTDEEVTDTEFPDEDFAPFYNFDGKWAMLNFTTSNVTTTIPVIGQQKSVSTTSAYALVEMTDNGDGTVSAMGTTCDMVINSGSNLIEIIISDNYIAHLSPTIWTFSTVLGRSGVGYDVSATDVLTMNGLRNFANPMTDPLPTDKSDPRVFDQDEDGHPGMTVDCIGHIPMVFNGPGTMYTVQRTIVDMVGETKDDSHIEGILIWESEQVVLEASNSALLSEKTIDPDYANSWFKMVRIDSSWTCPDIITNEGTLFPR